MTNEKYKLSDSEHQRILDYLTQIMLKKGKTVGTPNIIILGGQPASGKSRLGQFVMSTFLNGTAVSINGDDYRSAHPHFKEIIRDDEINMAAYTDPDVRLWVPKLLEKAVEHRFDIVFEATLRNKYQISTTITDIKNTGYNVSIAVTACPGYSSRIGIIERYEGQKQIKGHGRWTNIANHDEAYRKLPVTLRHLENNIVIDRLIVCDRKCNIIYLNERDKNGVYTVPDKRNDAAFALEKERNISITKELKEEIEQRKRAVLQKMADRDASRKEIILVKEIFRRVLDIQKINTLSR